MNKQPGFLRWFIAAAFTLGLVPGLFAEDAPETPKPFITFAASSYNDFIDHYKAIGEVAENPAFASMVEVPINFFLGADMMEAADKDALIGGAYAMVGDMPGLILVLPLDEPETLCDFFIEKQFAEDYSEVDGVFTIDGDMAISLQARKMGDWVVLVTTPELFDAVPEDPSEMFYAAGRNTLAYAMNFQNIPTEIKDGIQTAFSEGVMLAGERIEGETEEMFAQRQAQAKMTQNQLKTVFESVDVFYLGVRVDADAKTMVLDTEVTFLPDTDQAKMCKKVMALEPRFTGFSGLDALLALYSAGVVDPSTQALQRRQFSAMMDTLNESIIPETDEEREIQKAVLEILKPLADELFDLDEMNMAVAIDLESEGLNAVLALEMENTAAFEKAWDDLVALARDKAGDEFKDEWLQTDVEAWDGVKADLLTLPVTIFENDEMADSDREMLHSLLGENLRVALARGDGALYFGVGTDPVALLKAGLEGEPTSTAQGFVSFSSLKFMQYLKLAAAGMKAATTGDAELDERLAKNQRMTMNYITIITEWLKSAESSAILVEGNYMENGQRGTIILQEGVLKVIGNIPSLYMMSNQAPF